MSNGNVFGISQGVSDEVKSRNAYDSAVKDIHTSRDEILFNILSKEFKDYLDYFVGKQSSNLKTALDSVMYELQVRLPEFFQATGGFDTEVVIAGEKKFVKGGYKHYPEAETRSKLVEPLLKTFFPACFSEEV